MGLALRLAAVVFHASALVYMAWGFQAINNMAMPLTDLFAKVPARKSKGSRWITMGLIHAH